MIELIDESPAKSTLDLGNNLKNQEKKLNKSIIPIASGKGGVGKTFFSVNLGIQLAHQGKRVVLIDLDIGGSNLHTYLGMKGNAPGLGEFLQTKSSVFSNFCQNTHIENLDIIRGDQMIPDLANITHPQKMKIQKSIYNLDYDFIILDLGAGAHTNVVDFFLMSNMGIVISSPTHAAILNSFSFLKTCVYRYFRYHLTNPKLKRLINIVKKKNVDGEFPSFWDVINRIAGIDKDTAINFKAILDKFRPAVLFNMIDSKADIKLVRQLIDLIYNKLLLELDVIGSIPRNDENYASVKARIPLSISNPSNHSINSISRIATKLIERSELNKPLYDISQYESSIDEIEDEYSELVEEDLNAALANQKITLSNPEIEREIDKIIAQEGNKIIEMVKKMKKINNQKSVSNIPSVSEYPSAFPNARRDIFNFPSSNIN